MKLFGTDGIRGLVNCHPIHPNSILQIAMAAGTELIEATPSTHRPTVVIGKDTRLSGYMIESALECGFVSMGVDVILLGPIPTPAVAYLTRSLRADLGVMISASHNPYHDNGIKFFDRQGKKWDRTIEQRVEKRVDAAHLTLAKPSQVGRGRRLDDGSGRYLEFVKTQFPKGMRLDGLKIVLDCAHGAAYRIAPQLFWELGAEVISIGIHPSGTNINAQCGATFIQKLREKVRVEQAHLGIALDGDADRIIMVDELGSVLDGDHLLAAITQQWHQDGQLRGQGIVATVLSNWGLEQFLNALQLQLFRSAVGDKAVFEQMQQLGCNVGGEQSGHIIFADLSTTGDGILAALQILSILIRNQRPASDLSKIFTRVPQVLRNFNQKGIDLSTDRFQQFYAEQTRRVGQWGRLLVRPSGTEPMVRIMVESENTALIQQVLDNFANFWNQSESVSSH